MNLQDDNRNKKIFCTPTLSTPIFVFVCSTGVREHSQFLTQPKRNVYMTSRGRRTSDKLLQPKIIVDISNSVS